MKKSFQIPVPAAGLLAAMLMISGCWNAGGNHSPAVESGLSAMQINRATEVFHPTGRSTRFTRGWQFFKGEAAGAQSASFDDAKWRYVDLPHDWSIEGPFAENWASGTGYLPAGVGWYRKKFICPDDLEGRRVSIRFEAVYHNSQVWCNGQLVGSRPFGYIPFEFDLTPLLRVGQENVIAVRVDHSDFADSRWYPGSGIIRDVFLNVTDDLHIATGGIFITTPTAVRDSAHIVLSTTVKNESATDVPVTVVSTIIDAQGQDVGRTQSQFSIAAGGQWDFDQSTSIAWPSLWSPTNPALYDLKTQVIRDGNVVDECHTPFGVRTFHFDPDKGFSINGQAMKLKGVCLHDDAGALGAVTPAAVWDAGLRRLRDAGCNAIRTSHNPPPTELLDLCDRLGFLVMDEAFDEWTRGKKKWVHGVNRGLPSFDGYHTYFANWAKIDLRDMLLRDRNHPSIILWSIGNEIDFKNDPYPPNSDELPPVAAMLIKVIKQYDLTRPVTAACASVPTNLFCDELDVVGYNYQEPLYAADHAAHPARVIYGSENKHTAAAWQAVARNDYIAGQFLWTGIDYLGEAAPWPNRSRSSGLLDLAGFEKPQYYFRKSLWTDQPMVYLDPASKGITCYTNCQSVELFQDGQLVSEKPLPDDRMITWPVLFTGSTLKAVGKNAGAAVCSFELKKPGAPGRIAIKADVESLKPDGRDLAQIEACITDADGNVVTDASSLVHCTIHGPGRLLGMESGDPDSHESYQADFHKAYRGHLLIYVQSTGMPGNILVQLTAQGLSPAQATISARQPAPTTNPAR